jgi:hypothetical protein
MVERRFHMVQRKKVNTYGRNKYNWKLAGGEEVLMENGDVVQFNSRQTCIKRSFLVDGRLVMRIYWRNGKMQLITVPEKFIYKFAARGFEYRIICILNAMGKGGGYTKIPIEDKIRVVARLSSTLEHGAWEINKRYYEDNCTGAPQIKHDEIVGGPEIEILLDD